MKRVLIFLFVLSSTCFYAQESNEIITESSVTFKIKNLGLNVDGSFLEVEIDAIIDKDNLERSFINAKIMVNSVQTGMEGRDSHILKEDFFDESNYKTISFKSSKIERVLNNTFQVDANLTIKDITKKISIPIFINTENDEVRISSEFEINRIDYGVGGRSFMLGKTVKINVNHSFLNRS